MPHKKPGWVKDVFGELFEVAEFRGTTHGFDLLFGWPEHRKKGFGVGRCEVIITRPLAEHLKRFHMRPWAINLPIAATTLCRMRRELGHHIRRDIRRWWEDRLEDLATLSRVQFANRHRRNKAIVSYHGKLIVGRQIKPVHWWKRAKVQALLFSNWPDSEIAAALKVSPNSVRRLRSQSRKAGLVAVAGPLRRPDGWWKDPDVQTVLFSGRLESEIAEDLKVGVAAVPELRSRARKAGLVPASHGLKRKRTGWWKAPKVQALLASRKPMREIARKLGVHPYRVSVLRLRSMRA